MIALTQFLVRYCLIIPAFLTEKSITGEMPTHLSKLNFVLLVISTILIAAGGYILNDIYDTDIDEFNKPGKNVIGKKISERVAMNIYYSFSAIGLSLAVIVAFNIGKLSLAAIPLFCVLSLYMYSTFYKKRFLSGNLIVAILSALSVLIVGLFEAEFYRNIIYLLYYGLFAFLISLIREIIKDAEDQDGDERAQCKSLPIILGIKKTKIILVSLIIATLAGILYVLYRDFYANTVISYWNLAGIFSLPLLALIYLIITADSKNDFHYASVFTKAYMLIGILSMAGLWYYFLR
jgi:4-hydroxybenzoate polyprenyltransferase